MKGFAMQLYGKATQKCSIDVDYEILTSDCKKLISGYKTLLEVGEGLLRLTMLWVYLQS